MSAELLDPNRMPFVFAERGFIERHPYLHVDAAAVEGWLADAFPDMPVKLSFSETFSYPTARLVERVIELPSREQYHALEVLYELAHIEAGAQTHGKDFVGALLVLVFDEFGRYHYVSLDQLLRGEGVTTDVTCW